MKKIPIVFAFDKRLVLAAKVCISSLLMNARAETFYDIFVLHAQECDFTGEGFDKLASVYQKNCRIEFRSVGSLCCAEYEIRGITTATYYRLLIPQLIPEYDKVIYSDVDVIFRSDLSDIYERTELGEYYMGGVNSWSHLDTVLDKYYSETLHLNSEAIIYAGNLIINSKQIREDHLMERFYLEMEKQYKYQDMDIINLVCKDRIKYLSPIFCYTVHINYMLLFMFDKVEEYVSREEREQIIKYGLIHYNGTKPWDGYCANMDIWWEYYRKSVFFDPRYYYRFFISGNYVYDRLSFRQRMGLIVHFFTKGRRKV